MEVRSSALDRVHLSRPDDHNLPTPLWPGTTAATEAVRVGASAKEDVDIEMGYDQNDDGDLEAEALHKSSIGLPFGFSSPSLQRHAPFPAPDIITSTHAASNTAARAETSSASPGSAGRPRGDQPPLLAVPFKDDKFADFRPWVGGSSEDVLVDSVVRNGYVEKSQPSIQTETNMARPAVWPSLKNKNGLPLLSMLLVQVMDKRQALGKCTAPSTFKPPPRVTLTDTKREAWLRDLASADVPLRRLSRTIPHGVRGKVLLDQCLSKSVPLARAIWLIKCVGANEIRAFRRKGISGTIAQSGETKWIREWTLCVEQFVTGTIINCGQKGWKQHVRFTVRLTAALFTEDLLDHNQFLEWLTASFASSPVELLPMWFLLVQLFWSHITGIQRRGQSLGEAIMNQLATLKAHPKSPVLESLLAMLHHHLVRLVRDHQSCLVGLKDWFYARAILEIARNQVGDVQMRRAFDEVIQRNNDLNPSGPSSSAATKPTRLVLFDYLDSLPLIPHIAKSVERCKEICTQQADLINALVDWGSSIYRTGIARTYLVISIMRNLADQGTALEHGILTALSNASAQKTRDQGLSAKIMADLVSSRHFNYGKYLQWLISTGAVWLKDPNYVDLLFSIPLDSLSTQSSSLRAAILARLGVHDCSSKHMSSIQSRLNALLQDDQLLETLQANSLLAEITDLKICDRSTICRWISGKVETWIAQSTVERTAPVITRASFAFIRTIFETTFEFRSLANILQALLPSASPALFVEYAATVEHNISIFASMGALESLTSRLMLAYVRARHLGQLTQNCILSVISICRLQSTLAAQVKRLESDLLTLEQQHAAAVCSPASDSMLSVQSGSINADEDIDRILASGNTMDEQILARLFSAIVERTVKWTINGNISLSNPSRWFAQLRAFDTTTFDRHMNNLVSKLVANVGTDQVRAILISLVTSGCLKFHETLSAFEKRLDSLEATSAPQLARYALGTLHTFIPLKDLDRRSREPEIYRFRIAQKQTCDQNRATLLRFVWHALSAPSEASGLLFSQAMVTWLSACCITEADVLQRGLRLREGTSGHRGQQLAKILSCMCRGVTTYRGDLSPENTQLDVSEQIRQSDELRLPFVRLLLVEMSVGSAPSDAQHDREILNSMEVALQEGNPLWTQLIDSIGSDVVRTLRQKSWTSILRRAADYLQTNQDAHDDGANCKDLEVAAITACESDADEVSSIDQVAETLQMLTERLAEKIGTTGAKDRLIYHVTSLVRLLITGLPAAATAEQAFSGSSQRILRSICQLTTQGMLHSTSIETLLLDYATMLLRPLPSDSLSALYRRLPDDVAHDVRIRSMLGIAEQETKWLSLASKLPSQQPPNNSPTTGQGPFQAKRPPGSAPQSPLPQGRSSMPAGQDTKYTPYNVRKWELMQDPTPNAGENDAGISLTLFAARRIF